MPFKTEIGRSWGRATTYIHTYIHTYIYACIFYPPQPIFQMDEMSRSWKFDDSCVEDVYVTTWGWTFVGKFAVINHSTKFSRCFCGHEFAFIAKAPAIWGDSFLHFPTLGTRTRKVYLFGVRYLKSRDPGSTKRNTPNFELVSLGSSF